MNEKLKSLESESNIWPLSSSSPIKALDKKDSSEMPRHLLSILIINNILVAVLFSLLFFMHFISDNRTQPIPWLHIAFHQFLSDFRNLVIGTVVIAIANCLLCMGTMGLGTRGLIRALGLTVLFFVLALIGAVLGNVHFYLTKPIL